VIVAAGARRARRRALAVVVAGLCAVGTGGACAQAGCSFRTALAGFPFGSLDPSAATTRTQVSTVSLRCTGSATPAWQFSGANGSAPLRMKHASANAFIPYTVSAAYVSGPQNNQRWDLTATVLGQNYQNALVGSYSDLLTATVLP